MPIDANKRKELDAAIREGKQKGMAKRKELFLSALKRNLGVLTPTFNETSVDRCTYNGWLNKDPEFKQSVEDVHEELLDFGEKALIQKLKEADTQTILFFAKSKLAKRGYSEKQETTTTGNITIRIVEDKDA